jgi:hypothetical protein
MGGIGGMMKILLLRGLREFHFLSSHSLERPLNLEEEKVRP